MFTIRFILLSCIVSRALAFQGVAFGVQKIVAFQPVATTTTLKYTVFGGIDEEESQEIEQIRPTKVVNGGAGDLSGYRDISDSEADSFMNIDAYDNMAGGSIMPGMQLSALCGDD